MLAPLALAAFLWGLVRLLRGPRWLGPALALGVIALVMAAHLILPESSQFRAATGGDIRPWVILTVIGGFAIGYAYGLRWLKARARPAPSAPEPPRPRFTAPELDRYARHIMLREIGGPGQSRLQDAHVLVVGAGGLGAPALLYLAAAGVGHLRLVDDDVVELSNLQRQIIHDTDSLGQSKSASAARRLAALNPHPRIEALDLRFAPETAEALLTGIDLVLDGSDSFATRYALNAACARRGIPLIAGAMSQWEGQISIWDPARGAPCYACIFPEAPAPGLVPSCAEAGIVAPLPGVIGSLMALEAVKLLTGAGTPLRGRLLIVDALEAETRRILLRPRADCPVCSGRAADQPRPTEASAHRA